MQYAIIVYETDAALSARDDAARAPAYWASYTAYSRALAEAGIARGGAGLEPPRTATTLRLRDGQRQVQDPAPSRPQHRGARPAGGGRRGRGRGEGGRGRRGGRRLGAWALRHPWR